MSSPIDALPTTPAERLRVGDCLVDIPLREIQAPGSRRARRITPKAMGVLLLLAEQANRVVSRDTLLARVWPDTLPTDDVVTQAITQLRKALGDERGNPRYIETIAKTGYRLLAPLEWLGRHGEGVTAAADTNPDGAHNIPLSSQETPLPRVAAGLPASFSPPRRGGWGALLGSLAVAALLTAGVVLWTVQRERMTPQPLPQATEAGEPRPLPFRLITSLPGYELGPSLSPDAALVAYFAIPAGRRDSVIMVQTTNPSSPRQLTHPPQDSSDVAPAWSPDGRTIAFLRVTSGTGCSVMMVPANSGTERSVGDCNAGNPPSFDWLANGEGLIFSSGGSISDDAGLRVLDLGTGRWRTVSYGASAADRDEQPRYSPDGRWIVFVRNSPLGDLWRIPATGGPAQRLTSLRGDIRKWDWLPDGRSVVLARWNDSDSRLYRLDLDTQALVDLGIDDGEQPSVAARVPALAFSQRRNYFGIYRYSLTAPFKGERLYPSSGRDRLPSIAPDGRQLVFASDRSGQFGLWWADLKQAGSLRLIDGVLPGSRHLPEWSPDSRRVLVIGADPQGGQGVHEVLPGSGRVFRLPVPLANPVQALYLPGTSAIDRQRLLVVAGADRGRLRLTLFDRSSHPWRTMAVLDDVSLARVDHAHQRLLLARASQPGLWSIAPDLDPASLRVVSPDQPLMARYRSWAVDEAGQVYFEQSQPGCTGRLQLNGAASTSICLERDRYIAVSGFSVNARDNRAYVTMSEWIGGDIGFMNLPVIPESLWPGVIK